MGRSWEVCGGRYHQKPSFTPSKSILRGIEAALCLRISTKAPRVESCDEDHQCVALVALVNELIQVGSGRQQQHSVVSNLR